MTRAILRGYDLTEPDQTHAVRLLGSVFHGYVSLEMAGGFSHSAPDSQEILGLDPGRPRRPAAQLARALTSRGRAAGGGPPRRAPAHLNNPES